MDFSKLGKNEKLASIGAVVAIVGGLVGGDGEGDFDVAVGEEGGAGFVEDGGGGFDEVVELAVLVEEL